MCIQGWEPLFDERVFGGLGSVDQWKEIQWQSLGFTGQKCEMNEHMVARNSEEQDFFVPLLN